MIRRFTSMTFGVLLAASAVSAAEPQSREILNRYESSSVRRVQIELPPATTLEVRTSADPIISIEGSADVQFEGSWSRVRRQAVLEGIDVVGEVESSNRLKIIDRRTGAARNARARRLTTNFTVTITVPEWTNVEVRQRDGMITLDGDFGDVIVGLRSGEIRAVMPKARVKDLAARARVGEVKADFGRVTEEREGFLPGETTYESPSGQTVVRLNVTFGSIDVRLKE